MSPQALYSVSTISWSRLLVLAFVWHLAFALAILLVGRTEVLPQTFDANGIGVSFAIDSRSYRIEAEDLAQLLHHRRLQDWFNYKASFHVKLYSLSFALLGRFVGFNILAAEPFNLICYLSILGLVFAIASETFDPGVARLATILVGIWPSLLLHTTQMLRDVVFIPAMLLLVLALLLCANRPLSVKQGILVAGAAGFGTLLLWLCRGDMWELVFLIILVGAGFVALAQFKGRSPGAGKTVAIISILLMALWIPNVVPNQRRSNQMLQATRGSGAFAEDSRSRIGSSYGATQDSKAPWSKLATRVGLLRHKFIVRYPLAGSNIDSDVELSGLADVVRYLPRAVLIGLFSPFPNMWFTAGAQVGIWGRLVAGAEMLVFYLMFGLAIYALTRHLTQLSFWLLLVITFLGCTALGYVVVNSSSLYRMRYVFFILLTILGARGLRLILSLRTGAVQPGEKDARVV